MQFTETLLLLSLSVGTGFCFLDSRNFTVTRYEQHIDSPGYPHHTWRSERKVLTFTALNDDSHMVFYITGDFGQQGDCSGTQNAAAITFKEVTEGGEEGKPICGTGDYMYESHGSSVVTAVIAEGMEEKFRITYTLKSNRCQETLFAYPNESNISSPDIAWNMSRCQWNIVAGYGYVVQVRVLLSNLSCYGTHVDVDFGNGSTQSWCGQRTPSYTSTNSRMSIRFNMSSVGGGHAFTLAYKGIPNHNRTSSHYWTSKRPTGTIWPQRNTQFGATNTPNVASRPWTTREPWLWTTRNPWLLNRPRTTSHYWTSKRPTGTIWPQGNTQFGATATPTGTSRPWTTRESWKWTTRNPGLLNRPRTTSHYWTSKRPTGAIWPQRNTQFGATATPTGTNRPWTTRKPWLWTTRNPWLLHRPGTTSNQATSNKATQGPPRTGNQTEYACVGGNVRTIMSGHRDKVLHLTKTARTKCGWRLRTGLTVDSNSRLELKMNFPSEMKTSYDVCHDRYLEVFDGPSCNSPFLGKWCGQTNQTLVSTGQDLFLVYADGKRYTWLPWRVHYTVAEADAAPAVGMYRTSQTASSSSQTGVVIGSVFGVVVLVLAVVGALIAWRMYGRKKMSPNQNQDIIRHSEAESVVFTVTPAAFSNAAYEEVKSPEMGKEAAKAPCNPYDTPNTNEQHEFHRNQYLSLSQPPVSGYPKGNVEHKSATYDNHVRDGKEVSAPGNGYATPHKYGKPQLNLYHNLPLNQPLNRTTIEGNVEDKSVTYDNHVRGEKGDSEI